ncbi:DUF2855 family protein [Maribacter algarum]|uniref:DUF2855 family protein n=1 Tax=Maribacter algarum (ex Zhang et al. 2020) TaxID=2578118 RepID=UPI001BB19570|nr:DUF2855 family protein [Maribacter algarum]
MLETDYLVIGSGAVGMAFVDTLLSETDANIIMIDRYANPGGHWNVAYPFVTLHQPSQFYGVSSKELSNGRKDETGTNKGLYSLAKGSEINAYYEDVMQNTFLSSGRVKYFPNCNYKGNREFESFETGEKQLVKVNKKVVDTTILGTSVPATHTPNFAIEDGVQFMPLNDLPKVENAPKGYVVIGGGKTGIDACLWLLEKQVNPNDITWIVSRDAWLLDRKNTQPTDEFFETSIGSMAAQLEVIPRANSIPDLFYNLAEAGVFLRLDKNIRPTMFHGATVSQLELVELRKIRNIIRLGRVQRLETNQIIMDRGAIPTSTGHIHIDCSATAITQHDIRPIFEDGLITPQTVRSYQPVFSASVIAYVEAHYGDDKTKNTLCQVVLLPNHDTDWIKMLSAQLTNQFIWSKDKDLRKWLVTNRLNGFGRLVNNVDKKDADKMALLKRMRSASMPAMMRLEQFISKLDEIENSEIENPQFQVNQNIFIRNRIVETPSSELKLDEGDVLVKVEKFAYTANNITYAVAGDTIGYWQFFPPVGENTDGWGVIPVWGFASVVESKTDEIPIGDRLFGYFPPAKYLKMKPVGCKEKRFIDGSPHRSELPVGYNIYRRVHNEKNYNSQNDRERMLLFPLHLTSFCLWDALQEKEWYGAKQLIILSASSKTSTGLGYALKSDENAPNVIGVTSRRNLETVKNLNIYNHCLTYKEVTSIDSRIPTVIVDMSGNQDVLAALHTHLGDQMKFTSNVGLTHWANAKPKEGIISERSKFFFAPGHIQKRMKEWGAERFDQKTTSFLMKTTAKTKSWLKFKQLNGLHELVALHPLVCAGVLPPDEGLIVNLS